MANSTAASAASKPVTNLMDRVLTTVELLEGILLHLDTKTLLFSQRVSKTFQQTINGSIKLQQALFFTLAVPENDTLRINTLLLKGEIGRLRWELGNRPREPGSRLSDPTIIITGELIEPVNDSQHYSCFRMLLGQPTIDQLQYRLYINDSIKHVGTFIMARETTFGEILDTLAAGAVAAEQRMPALEAPHGE